MKRIKITFEEWFDIKIGKRKTDVSKIHLRGERLDGTWSCLIHKGEIGYLPKRFKKKGYREIPLYTLDEYV